jgi:hypothetical protein
MAGDGKGEEGGNSREASGLGVEWKNVRGYRSPESRKEYVVALLSAHHPQCWVATASRSGDPHLVPLSFAWREGRVIICSGEGFRLTKDLVEGSGASLAIGDTRDVVLIRASVEASWPAGEQPPEVSKRFATQADWDPSRLGKAFRYFLLKPERIDVWRQPDEMADRTIMRCHAWVID